MGGEQQRIIRIFELEEFTRSHNFKATELNAMFLVQCFDFHDGLIGNRAFKELTV